MTQWLLNELVESSSASGRCNLRTTTAATTAAADCVSTPTLAMEPDAEHTCGRSELAAPEGSLAVTYDVRGTRYEIKPFCFCTPGNLLTGSAEMKIADRKPDERDADRRLGVACTTTNRESNASADRQLSAIADEHDDFYYHARGSIFRSDAFSDR